MTNQIGRRTVVKGAAWSIPVIAAAVAMPLAAATGSCPDQGAVYHYDPRHGNINGGEKNNVAMITVVVGEYIVVEFIKDANHPHVNIRMRQTDPTQNHHYPRKVLAGEKFTYPLDKCVDPAWIQVAGNNVHYYGGGVFH